MTATTLLARPLTRQAFAPYGDVIETGGATAGAMNAGRFERFDALARIVCAAGDEHAMWVAIVRAVEATPLPYRVTVMERHPHASQAFVPRSGFAFVVVVARAGAAPGPTQLAAFISDGSQGVNYRRGTWHMPLIALEVGQEFLVIDRQPGDDNCDVHHLDGVVMLDLEGEAR